MEENSSLSTSSALSWWIEMCIVIQLTIAMREGKNNNWAVWMSTKNYQWGVCGNDDGNKFYVLIF
jgi:hypothetical protein